MRLIVDTNAFVADFRLESAAFRMLRESAGRAGVYLGIPQLVWDEALGKFSERFAELHREFDESAKRLERISGWKADAGVFGCPERARAEYETRLKALLAETGGAILPYPNVSHDDIVKRILARKKPFKLSGEGYRDYLLWQIVLSELKTATAYVHFVTADSDFLNNSQLHDDLYGDLIDAGMSHQRLVVHQGLGSFVEAVIRPGLERLERMKEELGADRFQHFSVLKWANRYLQEVISDFDYIFVPFISEGSCYLRKISDIKVDRVTDVIRIPSSDLIVRVYLSFDAVITASLYNNDQLDNPAVRRLFGSEFQGAAGKCAVASALVAGHRREVPGGGKVL